MEPIRAIIVDDEEDSRKVLKKLIQISNLPVEVISMCEDLEEAVESIRAEQPDVVFLDVHMPKYAGYEIIDFFDEITFEIVFVTAYDDYALKAFELSAIDYVLKPINRFSLNETLQKIVNSVKTKQAAKEFAVLREAVESRKFDKIVIPEIGGNLVLQLQNIISIKGDGNYSVISLVGGTKYTVSKNLKYFEQVIEGGSFFRTQKSWIINMDHLKRFNSNTGEILLTDDLKAKLSPHRSDEFKKQLNL